MRDKGNKGSVLVACKTNVMGSGQSFREAKTHVARVFKIPNK